MIFYATFHPGQPLSECYCKVDAYDWHDAAEKMTDMYSEQWACIFPEDMHHRVGDRREAPFGVTNREVIE